MLAALSPADLFEARIAYEVVPLNDGWRQAGTIAATFHNELERYAAAKAGKSRLDKSCLRTPQDYIPKVTLKRSKEIHVNQSSIDAFQKMIEGQYRR